MSTFHATSDMPCDVHALYQWHARPGALERLTPPWQRVHVAERRRGQDHPRIGNGAIARLMIGIGPLSMPWVAEHFDHDPPHGFSDRQLSGPFGRWVHRHAFIDAGDGSSRLDDRIEYDAPGGFLGSTVLGGKLAADLDRLFWFRHARTRQDLARHARSDGPLTVAIAGSSGMIGSALAAFLSTGGHHVVRLVRGRAVPDPVDGIEQRHWDPAAHEISPYTLAGVDAVVNLCGENIASGRWTDKRKTQLERSRIGPTSLLARAIASLPAADRPAVLVNASGVHAYGDRGDQPLDESSGWGDGFLPGLVRKWEAATRPAESAGVRVVHARFGMVLGAYGGALKALLTPTRLGLGGPIGSGRQWWPWIGLDDAVGAVHHAIASADVSGALNICAPNAATANDVTSAVAEAARRPAILGLPAGAARTLLGEEMAADMLLASTRAEPTRLGEHGFRWMHPTLADAIGWELGCRRLMDQTRGAAQPRVAANAQETA
ncbi:MAG: TIGR01777 family oxidoreductase [Phycisphaerales bacterium]